MSIFFERSPYSIEFIEREGDKLFGYGPLTRLKLWALGLPREAECGRCGSEKISLYASFNSHHYACLKCEHTWAVVERK